MRKITLSVLSFALGALSMSLSGNQTSTSAQESTKRPPAVIRPAGAIPEVPPFRGMTAEGITVIGSRFAVDGILCKNCTFTGTTFEYGGGEYFLDGKVLPPVSIDLIGAARNTATFLNTFGLIGCPAKQTTPNIAPQILQAKYVPSGILKSEHAHQ